MAILDKVLGNATEVSEEELKDLREQFINENETVVKVYKLTRDMYIFTDKRILVMDIQGATGKKVQYKTIFYKSISMFTIETVGSMDMEAELKIWISTSLALDASFSKSVNIFEIGRIISKYTAK